DLADYSRFIQAKASSIQARLVLYHWNQQDQYLELQQKQLHNHFSEALSQQLRQLEAQHYKDADDISQRFPELSELFETTPTEITQIKSSIPAGTVVIQPVSLPHSVAIFVLSKEHLNVVQTPVTSTKFDQLLSNYLEQLQDDSKDNYIETGGRPIYDILIRPIEKQIQALSPKQLSIIATDKLRSLPFETLYDKTTQRFLIQNYPINYLTRISTRSLQSSQLSHLQPQKTILLAFGNPLPSPQLLLGAENEINQITHFFPGSQAYVGKDATLAHFKAQAYRFPFIHLATHGCFQDHDCQKFKLKQNTLLFADNIQFNLADAALLGLKGTQLLTLAACQTAQETKSSTEGIVNVAYIFERAGAQAVMASLWAADDKATQQLMIDFYKNLQHGMTKAQALQHAKLNQLDRHPYFWSSFILIGDAY
ncbi:MAG: CHAT domain-containing protein, partial [Rhizonema sp. PD37]|nr:CHAT domain-containing protein [Rhizonema sp. PD37]